ncbi:ATP-dependent RNA helicase dbp10 [Pseudocyphellaria aurata]|nr:ATP-dependent RNA helicase dbp10 [Pseudocyphellaria aurata]
MPRRAPSPVVSENELDISHALFANDDGNRSGSDERGLQHPDRKARMQATGSTLDFGADSTSDDGGFIADTQAASNRKVSNLKGRSVKKGGGFQAMGLNANLLKAITRKGFSVPTPIQRKTIPLLLDGQDVVGMARTGSGKTAAFVVPMIEKLKSHSAKVGARALVLSPSRELALQTLKVVKELARGTDLKCVLLVGGDSLEEQFNFMTANPDIIIATPGRFLHLKVEMALDLSSIRYVVFDEADRLFEMGFAAQLTEILHALPQTRQTLLFSATLPKSLVEFARAGLQEPKLVRLDAESKISPDLQSAFFTMKSAEKEGALLHILSDVIKIPTGQPDAALHAEGDVPMPNKKRKRSELDGIKPHESPTAHSTIVFAATKHHVDYLTALLRQSGFAVSHAYGSLDQTARKAQVQDFRKGITNILVVTDIAARGIDIPVLANVINYDFPAQPKIFVHRVGRTARAGQRGWSYSLVCESDAPYLLDLQLFLGRRMILGRDTGKLPNYAEDVVVGGVFRDSLDRNCEWIGKSLDENLDLSALRSVASKGEKLYLRTRNAASSESARRSKDVIKSQSWSALHPLFNDNIDSTELQREDMLARVSGYRPQETVFEIGKRGASGEAAEVMKKRRESLEVKRRRLKVVEGVDGTVPQDSDEESVENLKPAIEQGQTTDQHADMDSASEDELEVIFSQPMTSNKSRSSGDWKDSEFYMNYAPTMINPTEDRGYGVHSGSYNTASQNSNFIEAARHITMDLTNDDGAKAFAEPSRARGMRWDKKNKKYVARANDADGSKGGKMIVGESGRKIAASFRSGRFDAWRKSNKIKRLPRTGETEGTVNLAGGKVIGKRFRHNTEKAPKEADKFRDDYWKKKKMTEAAKEKRVGKFREGSGQQEIRGTEDLTRERGMKQKRREKNARPSKKRKN